MCRGFDSHPAHFSILLDLLAFSENFGPFHAFNRFSHLVGFRHTGSRILFRVQHPLREAPMAAKAYSAPVISRMLSLASSSTLSPRWSITIRVMASANPRASS